MNKIIVIATVPLLAACSGWKEYAVSNNCQATDQTLQKPRAEMSSMSYMAMGRDFMTIPMSPSTIYVRYENYRLFQCDNGPIWGPM